MEILDLKDTFLTNLLNILLLYNIIDYKIKILLSFKSSFKLIYLLLLEKLNTLRKYFK
jgi:hypothetical protein